MPAPAASSLLICLSLTVFAWSTDRPNLWVFKPSFRFDDRVRHWSVTKNLTGRANHRHVFIIARLEPAPENRRGLLNRAGAAAASPLCRRNFAVPCPALGSRGTAMKKLLVAGLVAGCLIPFEAKAQHRAGDAALGAVSGAVVLGPVGAVAGALIGYTAGPAIAHSWGVGRSTSRSRTRRATQSAAATERQAAASPSPAVKTPEPATGQKAAPPVQGFE
jgi:hypothetical protein